MYCWKCGNEIKDGQPFCKNCGAKQSDAPAEKHEKKAVGRMLLFIIVLVVVILLAGLTAGMFVKHTNEKREQERKRQWETYAQAMQKEVSRIKDQEKYYIFTEKKKDEFDQLIVQILDAIQQEQPEDEIDEKKAQLDQVVGEIVEYNQAQLAEYREKLEAQDVSFAYEAELDQIDVIKAQTESLLAEENYSGAWKQLDEWNAIIEFIQNPNYDYKLSVTQYDLSEYPVVTAYVSIENENGEFVDGLDADAFYVNEGKTLKGPFTKKTILRATPLSTKEGLSVGLVADVSGSMEYGLGDAQEAMTDFICMLDENEGDEVELTEFSEYSYTVAPFGTDFDEIRSLIDEMGASGQTRLYDTLVNEIERVRSRENAKCVIAFTDGMNNCGHCIQQDVINVAREYHIPVFLIGIGDECDAYTLREISEKTGGAYHHIADTSGLWDVYNSIYRQAQNVYLLQYEIDENLDTQSVYSNIYLRTQDGHAAKAENFVFDTREFFESMYNKFLIAGIDCQTKGERNLLDSGLIITTDEACNNKDAIAYQSLQSIKNGGMGSDHANTFAVLLDHNILSVEKQGDGYLITASADYDISKVRTYSNLKKNDVEKNFILDSWGELDDEDKLWIEENRTVQETVTLVKDSDGRWKFNTRKTDHTVVHQVYDAEWMMY